MTRIRSAPSAGLVVAALISMGSGTGQPPRLSYAEATAVTVGEPVRAGTTARVLLQIKVAPGFHIQSDKPRDPSLIPLTLTIDAPAGVSVSGLTFPPSKDFTLKGSDQPLAVFEGAFPIEARLEIAKDHPAGAITVPARLRYQACDDTTCFRPTTIAASWTLNIVAAGEGGRSCSDARPETGSDPGSSKAWRAG